MHRISRLPFQVKFCGVTTVEDARQVVQAGADAIGFNFWSRSKRYVAPELAKSIASDLPASCRRIGVFVDEAPQRVAEIVQQVGLDFVKLHGNEQPEEFSEFWAAPIIRAIAWRGVVEDQQMALAWASAADVPLVAFLVDAYDPVQRGGTGKVARWDLLAPRPKPLDQFPLILAGGLTAQNVAGAIDVVHPSAVDTASGIEDDLGRKDPAKMQDFVAAVRSRLA
jgi:phosphoribosylanthranilate isomerase